MVAMGTYTETVHEHGIPHVNLEQGPPRFEMLMMIVNSKVATEKGTFKLKFIKGLKLFLKYFKNFRKFPICAEHSFLAKDVTVSVLDVLLFFL